MRVTEEMKNVDGDPFKVHLNTLIGKNQEYFDHLGGMVYLSLIFIGIFPKDIVSVVCAYAGVANAPKRTSPRII